MKAGVNLVNFVNLLSTTADLFFILQNKFDSGLCPKQVNKVNEVHGRFFGGFLPINHQKVMFPGGIISSAVNFYEHLLTIKESMSGFLHAGVNFVNLVIFEVHAGGRQRAQAPHPALPISKGEMERVNRTGGRYG